MHPEGGVQPEGEGNVVGSGTIIGGAVDPKSDNVNKICRILRFMHIAISYTNVICTTITFCSPHTPPPPQRNTTKKLLLIPIYN